VSQPAAGRHDEAIVEQLYCHRFTSVHLLLHQYVRVSADAWAFV
jgi:hypothetical protein